MATKGEHKYIHNNVSGGVGEVDAVGSDKGID